MMLQMLYFTFVCLLVYIPHTSIQDGSIPIENHHHLLRREITTDNIDSIEHLIQWLTEQQYQYETAYYALALNNVFPNFAKLFHERSEQKYHDVRGLIRLCQILNLDLNLQFISPNAANKPLRLLSSDRLNRTNFVQFFSDLKTDECKTIFTHFSNVYRQTTNTAVPLQMYLKKKLLMKQLLTCKLTTDLYTQLDRFSAGNSNDRSIPFSFMFVDSRAKLVLPQ